MTITLYINKSQSNVLTKQLYLVGSVSGALLNQSDLINPTILIELTNFTYALVTDDNVNVVDDNGDIVSATLDNTFNINYCYIEDFNRYYFVKDVTFVRKDHYILNLHVDVLSTYKDDLLNTTALIERNEYEYDATLFDNLATTETTPTVNELGISLSGNLVNTTLSNSEKFNTIMSYVYGGTCENTDFDGGFSSSNITSGISILPDYSLGLFYKGVALGCVQPDNAIAVLKKDDNAASFVYGLTMYPFKVSNATAYSTQRIIFSKKTVNYGPVVASGVPDIYNEFNVAQCNFQNHYHVVFDNTFDLGDDYFSKTAKYEIYIPFDDYIEIDYNQLHNKRVLLVYCVTNYITGSGLVYLINYTDNRLIYSNNVFLGVIIPLTTTNYLERSNNEANIRTSTAIKLLGATASVGIGAYMGSGVGVVGGIMSGVGAVANYQEKMRTNYLKCNTGNLNSNNGFFSKLQPTLRITKISPLNYNDAYNHLNGRPLYQFKKLDDLQGYTKISQIELNNIGIITIDESQELFNMLYNGVYLDHS